MGEYSIIERITDENQGVVCYLLKPKAWADNTLLDLCHPCHTKADYTSNNSSKYFHHQQNIGASSIYVMFPFT